MESQPQNPEFRIDPENFHPCIRDFGGAQRLKFGLIPNGNFYQAFRHIHLILSTKTM